MLFSIIVPVYNGAAFLEKSIQSVLLQTYTNFQLIVIDDGSTDDSFRIAQSIEDARISVLHQENGRQGKARNFGLQKAEGDYVLFLDADDSIDRNLLEEVNRKICEEAIKKDIYFYDYRRNYANSKVTQMPFNKSILDAITKQTDARIISNASPCLAAYSRMFLIENDIKFIEGVYFEDVSFMVQTLSMARSASYVEGVNYNYLIHDNSTVRSGSSKRNLDLIDNFKFIKRFLKERNLYEELVSAYCFLAYKYIAFEAAVRTVDADDTRTQQNEILDSLNEFISVEMGFDRKNSHFKSSSVIIRIVVLAMIKRKYGVLRLINKIRRIKG